MKPRFRLDHGRLIPIQRMQYGYAVGCFELSSRGQSWGAAVTMWPKSKHGIFFTGGENARPAIQVRGVPLWSQEMFVYLSQRKEICWAALKDLEKACVVPRAGETIRKDGQKKRVLRIEFDLAPHPEDFGGDQ